MVKDIVNNCKKKFIKSFNTAWNGKEKLSNIFLWWGGVAYLVTYFFLRPIVKNFDVAIIDYTISSIISIYFIFHIVLIRKNCPKKPKLTKKEKKALKAEKKKNRSKTFIRKLLLKEPITKWRPALVFSAVDLLIISTYLGYIA